MARIILMILYGSAWAVSNPVHVYSIYAYTVATSCQVASKKH